MSGVGSGGLVRAPRRRGSFGLRASALGLALLLAASWAFVVSEHNDRYVDLFSSRSLANLGDFLGRLAGVGEREPAFLLPERWASAAGLALQTLAMSVLAIGFAAAAAMLTVMLGARPAAAERVGPIGRLAFAAIRASYVISRAVPELVWALMIVFVLAPGILAGALALGLHNFGLLGRLCAETVENIDRRPLRSIRAAGAGPGQALFYAVLPAVLPAFVTFVLYRWEVIIRTTIVVGFVSAAGLGREFRLALSFFHYSDVALLLAVYVLLVFAVDAAGAGLRRLAR